MAALNWSWCLASVYLGVFFALMAWKSALTTAVAYVDLGAWNTVVALTIAVTKMLLVVLFFMHVKYATGLTRVVIIAGFFWLGILLTFSLSDELTRKWEITLDGMEHTFAIHRAPLSPRFFSAHFSLQSLPAA